MAATPSVTLDTNLLFDVWEDRKESKIVHTLIDHAAEGRIDLTITARVRQDIPLPPAADRLNLLDQIHVNEGPDVWRLGVSHLGSTMVGADGFDERLSEAQQLASRYIPSGARAEPPTWKDWDHLHAHMLSGRDYFVTRDGGIHAITDWLSSEFGIVVLTPLELIERLEADVSPSAD